MKYLFIILIKFYKRFTSPFLPSSCRFYPTCSEYALEAFQKLGFFKAFYLSTKRILRCNPFFAGGYDPVPGEHNHIHLKQKSIYDLKKYYKIL